MNYLRDDKFVMFYNEIIKKLGKKHNILKYVRNKDMYNNLY